MKTSLVIGTFLLAGAGASSLGALPNPYQGSDTLFDLTTQALASLNLPANYIGGGSGNGQTAMVAGSQVTAPMSRMMNSGANLCTKVTTEAQGIVIGLDAVDVVASIVTGGSAACNSAGEGLVQSGSISGTVNFNGVATPTTVNFTNWKTVLKLVYGGEADPNNPNQTICFGPQRTLVVSNWSRLFQNQCANTSGSTTAVLGPACADSLHQTCTVTRSTLLDTIPATANGILSQNIGTCTPQTPGTIPLWHAFRRDDQSGTSDVFASLLGITPNTSATANNGFGASPYCNALNWDTGNGNGTTCLNGPHKQFTGPGGVYNNIAFPFNVGDGEVAPTLIHRRPPPNTWGDFPDLATNSFTDADVNPTSMQDNDPIRRPCLGTNVGVATKEVEEVCNLDLVTVGATTVGQLGLVLAVPDAIFIKTSGLNLFPTNACGPGVPPNGAAPKTLNCGPNKATKHSSECQDGDSDIAGICPYPQDGTTTNCRAPAGTIALAVSTRWGGSVSPATPPEQADGRFYNMWYTDGTNADGSVALVQQSYTLAKAGGGTTVVTDDSAQGMGRLHITSTVPAKLEGCVNPSATDQIGCLVQADQCSIGYAGDAAKTWAARSPNGAAASNNAALLVSTIAPTTTTVQLLGQLGEYPLARKLYMNTLEGWNIVANGPAGVGDPTPADELTLAKNEANTTFITGLLGSNGFFNLGAQSPQGADAPFCEDFNQQTVCAATSNDNACSRNAVAGIPGETAAANAQPVLSTVCGDGLRGPYEECDNGALNGTQGTAAGACLATCRCANVFVNGACN